VLKIHIHLILIVQSFAKLNNFFQLRSAHTEQNLACLHGTRLKAMPEHRAFVHTSQLPIRNQPT